jgi:hypothetical protein
MRFGGSDEDLSLWVELDDEPAWLDLTQDRLGEAILDLAVEGCLLATFTGRDPATGEPWEPLAESTLHHRRRLGLNRDIGHVTGNMLRPSRYRDGPRRIEPRRAEWTLDQTGCDYARHFQEFRRIVGWSETACDQAAELVSARLADGPGPGEGRPGARRPCPPRLARPRARPRPRRTPGAGPANRHPGGASPRLVLPRPEAMAGRRAAGGGLPDVGHLAGGRVTRYHMKAATRIIPVTLTLVAGPVTLALI